MPEPEIAQKSPYRVTVKEGQKVFWCACGLSKKQPFCDGSHKGGPFAPVAWTAPKDGPAFFCGCKASHDKPLCDGSHAKL